MLLKNKGGGGGGLGGFNGFQVWPILALRFRDLNRTGFWVLRYVAGCGVGHFCARISGILLKVPTLWGFQSHTVHVVN